jgi:hypothetical protein
MRKLALSLLLVFSIGVIASQDAAAQRGGFDMTAWLNRLDENENGKIDPDELEGRSGEFVKRMAERGGFKLDSAISIDDLSSKLQKAREDEREREGDRDRDDRDRNDRDRENRYAPKALVPGFGEPMDGIELPPGFDVVAGALVDLEETYEQKVIDYVDNIYDRYDKNDNGQLDPEEWGDIRWSSDPNASDLNNDGILAKEEFCERMVKRWGSGRLSKSSSNSGSSNRSSSGSSSSDESINERTRNYAASLIRLYDKDKNGSIDKKEQESMRGEWAGADSNDDGKLDEREIAAKLANYGKDSGGRSSGRSWGSRSDDDDDRGKRSYATASSEGRKTYRASTPDEKLPKGLPDWFTRNDANGDGQVQMSEYAAAWSDSRAEEFFAIDANGDGFITPAEAIEGGSSIGSSSDSKSSTSSYRGSSTSSETPSSESRFSRFRSR